MNFGLPPLTFAHVIISLIGIGSGFVVLGGFLARKRLEAWNAIFLVSTIATSVTGFVFFPIKPLLPSHAVGGLSLVVLAVAVVARYVFRLAGAWSWIYALSAVIALYFNVFVLVVQLFRRVPSLKSLAPTQSEPPFLVVQLAVLTAFVACGIAAVKRSRHRPPVL